MRCGRKRPETPVRLQEVQNVLASVVDIGAKTDYDALDPDVELKRACCHGGPESLRQANGQCLSVGYRGHGII